MSISSPGISILTKCARETFSFHQQFCGEEGGICIPNELLIKQKEHK
jgi:hypothetical protein